MNRTFVTGDVHGGIDVAKLFNFHDKVKGNWIPPMFAADQSDVNKNLEIFLQKVWDDMKSANTKFKWYCGHFHVDEEREVNFLYNKIVELK